MNYQATPTLSTQETTRQKIAERLESINKKLHLIRDLSSIGFNETEIPYGMAKAILDRLGAIDEELFEAMYNTLSDTSS